MISPALPAFAADTFAFHYSCQRRVAGKYRWHAAAAAAARTFRRHAPVFVSSLRRQAFSSPPFASVFAAAAPCSAVSVIDCFVFAPRFSPFRMMISAGIEYSFEMPPPDHLFSPLMPAVS
jgi:hypothetical protein